VSGHAGLYVGREPDNTSPVWASTSAVRKLLERVERRWRGIVMDTYALEKLTGWTPELSPPKQSPLYRPRTLAGEMPRLILAVVRERSRQATGPKRDDAQSDGRERQALRQAGDRL